ncbi:phospholipid-transporting ATPase ABCA3-like [Sabethes cyaneus]|uniref:phospholipid-transporting ATPase ABCA3-like n=1 Tax=Sabethes cyaneus TaxID=53552 RepID=UPI00237D6963|nr:phospholipid-transporting ATPase ABCA3-like [Sabethes cyaneus]
MNTSGWEKFVLLLWKNWIIAKRHYFQTFFEIAIPIVASTLLILIRGLVDARHYKEDFIYSPLRLDRVAHLSDIQPPITFTIGFSPTNAILERIVANSVQYLDEPTLNVMAFDNATAMENFLQNNNFIAGVEFPDSYVSIQALPEQVEYAIRYPAEMRSIFAIGSESWNHWQTNRLFPQFDIAGPRAPFSDDGGFPANYHRESFAQVQSAISRSIIDEYSSNIEYPTIELRRYPHPSFYSDPLLLGLENLLPVIIVVAFFYSCINTVKYITVEKELQLKESMKIMGLPCWLHWTAWFVKSKLQLLIAISLVTVFICVSMTGNTNLAVLTFAEWSVVWVYLFVYSIAIIMFCFMMSTFFSKANTAAGMAGLIWFVFVMPYNIAFLSYDLMPLGAKLALCLFHNSAMSFGFMLMMRHEGTTNGVQWSNLFSPVTVDDELSVGLTMVMLLVDSVIYLLIALYVEKVFPGKYGVAQPWYFPFTKEFWTNKTNILPTSESKLEEESANCEPEPVGLNAGIQIKGLRKEYSKSKVAVRGLNLNMFEDQITVLLGHNGAGKTTTMSMLTGVFSPTSGTALVDGCDIRRNIDGARRSLGLCPQHNVLFSELTVAEHLHFFARLKGVQRNDISNEIRHYVNILELNDKLNSESHTLSGGMKRKLAVGVALCGGSKVVVCDEPTSGMDPAARRALWDLLIKEKKGRTILLSTHFMDEADILGDRIAIMADGELKAVGSSFFLKKKFGVGYRLICVKQDECVLGHVTELIQRHIPGVEIDTDFGTEFSYVLGENHNNVFHRLLRDLEENAQQLHVSSYGISLTTMEEVFLKIGGDTSTTDNDEADFNEPDNEDEFNGLNTTISIAEDEKLLNGVALRFSQIRAMFLKKFIVTYKGWVAFIVQIFIPIFFVSMTIAIVRSFPQLDMLPSLRITFDDYRRTTTVLETAGGDPALANAYQQLFANTGSDVELLTITESMIDYILRRANENLPHVTNEILVGATISPNILTVWFNAQGFHTVPLTINTFFNALLHTVCPSCSIVVHNRPLPFRPETRFAQLQIGNSMGFQLAFNTGFAMAFVAALYVMFYIKERVSRAKLLQFVSGVNVLVFWATSFLWDFATYIITVLFYIATLAVFQENGWSSFEELGRVFLILMVFGFAFLPLTYLLSLCFDVPSGGFVKVMLLNIFTGIIFFMAVFMLSFDGFDLEDVARGLEWGFMIFPLFAVSHALSNMNIIAITQQICDQQCETIPECTPELVCQLFPNCCETNIFTWDPAGINRNLLFMTGLGIGSFLILMAIEYRWFVKLFSGRRSSKPIPPRHSENIDSDVLAEKQRIQSMEMAEINSTHLVLRDVTKYYKSFLAVNQLSVLVEHSQCFGLLGINGAGKTSTFKMLTGDEDISSGDAWVNGFSLKTDLISVHQQIGYCPQFDALIDDLTGRETLKIFALLRGVPKGEISAVSLKLATELNFMKHIDKRTKQYSGGNKRKLSTALALLGNPAVVYLDEPTTGMDPAARRKLWNVISKERDSGKSIVLTSHSMEECEALCTRLAIMVNGEFKCIGSTQHLKNKYSSGYYLTIKLKKTSSATEPERVAEIKTYITNKLPEAQLKEEYQESLTYHIVNTTLRWSTLFGLMEAAKQELEMEDYVLRQTTLEQVFLSFTKYQHQTNG